MSRFSETDREIIRRKRTFLSKTVAPASLPKNTRLTVFRHLGSLITRLPPELWLQFEPLSRISQALQKKTKKEHSNNEQALDTYSYLKSNRLLTDNAYAAAICTPTRNFKTINECEKYRRYQVLVTLSCLQLHLVGQHESAIQNALREIRLIATDHEHRPLLALLPDLDTDSTAGELLAALHNLRKQGLLSLLQRGLGFLDVAISDAFQMTKGIIRHREVEYSPVLEEDLALTRQEPTDDTDLAVSELAISRTRSNPGLDESDEPLDIRPGKVICVQESFSPHKAQALRALLNKRLVEQLSIRQQSLPCSFEQASEWDIQHLVAETVTLLSGSADQADPVALLLLSLISGRSAEQLVHRVESTNLLQEIKHHPCLCLTHSVPASKQAANCDSFLDPIRDRLILPLPAVLRGKITLSSQDTDKLKSVLRNINERHQTRLTLGRIAHYLEHWYLNQGLDRAEIALLRGEPLKKRPALSYSNLDADPIIEHHRDYIESVFRMAGIDPGMPPLHPTGSRLGSRLALPPRTLHNLFAALAKSTATADPSDPINYHNCYVLYVWALLVFVTGHRDVCAPMGLLGDYNPRTRTWWISDKEIRHGLAARTVVLPATAARQVELYQQHLRALAQRSRFDIPNICARCETALTGDGNLLFAIIPPLDKEATPADLCPSLLESLFVKQHKNKLPWARNWPRHHLRSELKRMRVSPEQIDGWMGHEEIGEEALGRHSALSLRYLDRIADEIELILKHHEIEAQPGWQTR